MDNRAFWLGAEVGRTESVSHVPTQTTNYKGSATPLSDKELSFFKGYLLRSGATAKKYSVYINPTIKMRNISVYNGATTKYTYRWAYLQNASISSGYIGFAEICYIILNSNKQKIDAEGNVVSAEDKSYYHTPTTLSLTEGTYYYREIANSCGKLLVSDYEFTVSGTSDYQTVEISHMPKLVKMEYHADYDIGDDSLSAIKNCVNTTSQSLLDSYYDRDKGKSLTVSLTYPRCVCINYDVDKILVGDNDFTDKFQISWNNDSYRWGLIDSFFIPDKTMSFGDETYTKTIYLENNRSTSRDVYNLYGYVGWDNTLLSNIQLPYRLVCECSETNTQTSLRVKRYYPLNGVEYSCQYEVNELSQIGDGYGEAYHGYVEEVKKIWGSLYQKRVTGYSIQSSKNTHPQIKVVNRQSSTLAESSVSTWNYWDTSGESHVDTTSKEAIITDNDYKQTFSSDIIDPTKGYVYMYEFIYNSCRTILTQNGVDLNSVLGGRLWYYETEDGTQEACLSASSRYNIANNPTIEYDSKITKAFIAAPIFYNEIKEGYENYFE